MSDNEQPQAQFNPLTPEQLAWSKSVRSCVPRIADLKVKIFADGADTAGMLELSRNPLIKGFTTNPTLMLKEGITDYQAFALDILQAIPDRPISFEVFSDDFAEMERQESINEDVIRFMTIRVDALEEGPSAMMRTSRRDDRDRGERGGRGFSRGRGFDDTEFAPAEEGVRANG